MTDPIEAGARAAARRLTTPRTPSLAADVEAVLQFRGSTRHPDRYLDPIAAGSLIVSAAAFGWSVYQDLRKRTAEPSREVVVRTVLVQLERTDALPASLTAEEHARIVSIAVNETLDAASPEPNGPTTAG
ncbi:hypothetical protein [Streptomyces sp.]|uniref:hypothetical protein n=1 Tax=Streptomyces sp. TaxID=1931 RepID=UPI002F40D27D